MFAVWWILTEYLAKIPTDIAVFCDAKKLHHMCETNNFKCCEICCLWEYLQYTTICFINGQYVNGIGIFSKLHFETYYDIRHDMIYKMSRQVHCAINFIYIQCECVIWHALILQNNNIYFFHN